MPQTSLPAQETAVPSVTPHMPSLAELAGPPHVPSLPELPGPLHAPFLPELPGQAAGVQKTALEQLRQEHAYTQPVMTVKPAPTAAKSAPMQFPPQPAGPQLPGEAAPTQLLQEIPSPAIAPVLPEPELPGQAAGVQKTALEQLRQEHAYTQPVMTVKPAPTAAKSAPMQFPPQPAGPQLPAKAAPTQLLQEIPSPAIAPVLPEAAPVTAAVAPHVQEPDLATALYGPAAPAAAIPDEKVLVQQNIEHNMEKLGWKVGTGALQLKFDRKGRVEWTESLFWDGPKDGYYFSTGEHGVGYYMDKAFVSSPTWQGKRAHKIFTRDGQTGYYFDDPVEVDSSEFLAMQSLGWLKSPAPAKEEQSQPAAVNKGLQVEMAAAKKAHQFELPVAKPVTTPAVEYGHRACWGLVNRLRKNPTRLAEQSEELQQLIVTSATNEADKKKLYSIIAGCNGNLKDINVKVKESFEVCDVENEKIETVPVTELELHTIYGEQTESVKRHKEAMGECKDDPNLPGAKIYLLAREKVEAGTETKRRCLAPSQLQCLICFLIKL